MYLVRVLLGIKDQISYFQTLIMARVFICCYLGPRPNGRARRPPLRSTPSNVDSDDVAARGIPHSGMIGFIKSDYTMLSPKHKPGQVASTVKIHLIVICLV